MKKNLFFVAMLVAGMASVGIAQLSSERGNYASGNEVYAPSMAGTAFVQDTTKKPSKDTVPVKQDSIPLKKDSTVN